CSSRRRHTRSKRDLSSDVCSSDLHQGLAGNGFWYTRRIRERVGGQTGSCCGQQTIGVAVVAAGEFDDQVATGRTARQADGRHGEIGRASCRDRVGVWVVTGIRKTL